MKKPQQNRNPLEQFPMQADNAGIIWAIKSNKSLYFAFVSVFFSVENLSKILNGCHSHFKRLKQLSHRMSEMAVCMCVWKDEDIHVPKSTFTANVKICIFTCFAFCTSARTNGKHSNSVGIRAGFYRVRRVGVSESIGYILGCRLCPEQPSKKSNHLMRSLCIANSRADTIDSDNKPCYWSASMSI